SSCGTDLGSHPAGLGGLSFNGGSTQSLAPTPGSFAINHGTNTPCPTIDQRYASRPATAADPRDIGAIEVDGTAPLGTPPANQTVEATSAAGAVATYTNATATDNVDGPVPATCTPASGSTFPLGVDTVTCSATDSSGNTGTATFTITVADTTGPAFTAPADQ